MTLAICHGLFSPFEPSLKLVLAKFYALVIMTWTRSRVISMGFNTQRKEVAGSLNAKLELRTSTDPLLDQETSCTNHEDASHRAHLARSPVSSLATSFLTRRSKGLQRPWSNSKVKPEYQHLRSISPREKANDVASYIVQKLWVV